MPKRFCGIMGDHGPNPTPVARIKMGWYNRATGKRDNEEVDVCRKHLGMKRVEFGPNPDPNMLGQALAPSFRVVKTY